MRAYIPVELSVDMTHMRTRVYITYYQYSIVLGAERNLFYGKISIFTRLKRSCPLHQAKNTYFCLIGAIIRGAHISIATIQLSSTAVSTCIWLAPPLIHN